MRKLKWIALLLTLCMLAGMLSPGLAEEVVASNVEEPAPASEGSADLQSFICEPEDAEPDEIDLNELLTAPEEISLVETPVYTDGATATGGEEFTVSGGKLTRYNGAGGAVTVPDGVTVIGKSAFENCAGVTSVSLPSGLLQIEAKAFSGCAALTTVNLPANLNLIGERAFAGCAALTGIVLPESLVTIEDDAFSGCAGIATLTVPASVSVLGSGVMADCTSLASFTFNNSISTLPSGFFSGCTVLASVTLPANLEQILTGAFEGCESLASLSLPATLATLGNNAFSGCKALESLALPAGMKSIGSAAFSGCEALAQINLPEKVRKIEAGVFNDCVSLRELVLPDAVSGKIGNSAFSGCASLTALAIPAGVTEIGAEAFKDCACLTSLTLPAGLTAIGSSAFSGCVGLAALTVPGAVTTVGNYAFKGCATLAALELPAGVVELGVGAFSGCTALKRAVIPNSLATVSESLFDGCVSLVDLNCIDSNGDILSVNDKDGKFKTKNKLPGNAKSVGANALRNCSSLPYIVIPQGVQSLGSGVFDNCGASTFQIGVYPDTAGYDYCQADPLKSKIDNTLAYFAVKQVTLDKSAITLPALPNARTDTIKATFKPDEATSPFGDWKSSDETVATVRDGVVTALAPGKATIVCKAIEDDVSATCEIEVYRIATDAIALSADTLTMLPDGAQSTATLIHTLTPAEPTNPNVVWTSSDTTVVTVADGIVTALAPGKATITCASVDDPVSATCSVTVNPIPVEAVTLSQTSQDVFPGATFTLTGAVVPANATYPSVVWSTSDPAVATVDGGVVKAVALGKADITCKSELYGVSATCSVTVIPIPVEAVTLSETSKALTPGATFTLTDTVSPANATYPSVVWSTSDPAVATVDGGVVKAISPGKADITCKSELYAASATCSVTVDPIPVETVTLSQASKAMTPGTTFTLTGTVSPADATYPSVVWSTSNPAVATVDGGVVKAIAPGKADITCKSELYDVSATCSVTVSTVLVESIKLNAASRAMVIGGTFTLTATITPASLADSDLVWSTSNTAVATVAGGTVTAVADGLATITCTSADGNASATCAITVYRPDDPDKPDDPDDPDKPDDPTPYKPDDPDSPDNPDNPLNPDNPDSPIKPIKPDPSKPEPVVPDPVKPSDPSDPFKPSQSDPSTPGYEVKYTTGVTLNVASLALVEGDAARLYAEVQPSNSWNRTVTWSSSDPGVVAVADGALTAVAAGTATVTATTFDGKTASAAVSVVKAAAPKKIAINAAKTLVIGVGEVMPLSVTMRPDNARSALTWTSSKATVAAVDANGSVTALKKGTATITVKTANKKKAKVKIKVVDPYEPTKITVNTSKTVTISVGETVTLPYTLSPATARTDLQWSSSKTAVAAVDTAGTVTGLKKGSSTVAVRTANGKKAKVKIKVVDPYEPLGVTLTTPTGDTTLRVGQKVSLIAVLSPSTAVTTFTWSSGKPSVAAVDANGEVTALKKGSATITVTTANKKKGKLKIKVVD